jgi:hypothetical protein
MELLAFTHLIQQHSYYRCLGESFWALESRRPDCAALAEGRSKTLWLCHNPRSHHRMNRHCRIGQVALRKLVELKTSLELAGNFDGSKNWPDCQGQKWMCLLAKHKIEYRIYYSRSSSSWIFLSEILVQPGMLSVTFLFLSPYKSRWLRGSLL